MINNAIKRWKKRGGNKAWTYTHCWKNIPRSEWSEISVLASVDNLQEALLARKQGYAPAMVVAEHSDEKAFTLPGSKIKWIPCPAQTKPGGREVNCISCRLCFDADRLFQSNSGIAFAAHGINRNKIKRRLSVIDDR